jgi:lipoyl(octanoyl) transferase
MNTNVNKKVWYQYSGLISYEEGLAIQTNAFQKIIDIKIKNRIADPGKTEITPNYLFFCEHQHVYTIGKSGSKNNLLIDAEMLDAKGVRFYETGRGGDITYHGPGQMVGYPVLDLENFFTDIHKYMRLLEESVIETLKDYHVQAGRLDGLTGVWVNTDNPSSARKICALGVKTSRWVTMHGFALNVNTDLSYFEHIIPCGIADKSVTSMEKELGRKLNLREIAERLLNHLLRLFAMEIARNPEKNFNQINHK